MRKLDLKRTSTHVIVCSALALGTAGLGNVALAASQDSGTSAAQASVTTPDAERRATHHRMKRGDHMRGHKHRHHHRMGKAAMLVPGYGPVPQNVVDSLSLTAEQTALLDDARSFINEQRAAYRDRAGRKADRSSPAVGTLDPHAAVTQREERFNAMQKMRAEGTQKWLALWDALDAEQQQTVSAHVVERHEKRAERRAEFRERRMERKAEKS